MTDEVQTDRLSRNVSLKTSIPRCVKVQNSAGFIVIALGVRNYELEVVGNWAMLKGRKVWWIYFPYKIMRCYSLAGYELLSILQYTNCCHFKELDPYKSSKNPFPDLWKTLFNLLKPSGLFTYHKV